jgi:DeoR/GlpR family transcriptional regulator of sugar metabolism
VSLIFDYDRCQIEILLNNYETHKMIMAAGNYNADNGSFSGELNNTIRRRY